MIISNSDNKAEHFSREIKILDSVLWLWFHSYISHDERSWHALDFPSTSMSSLDFLALNSGIIKGCIFYCNYLSRTLYLEKPCLIFRNQRWWWLSWQCTDFFRSKWISVLRDCAWKFLLYKVPIYRYLFRFLSFIYCVYNSLISMLYKTIFFETKTCFSKGTISKI